MGARGSLPRAAPAIGLCIAPSASRVAMWGSQPEIAGKQFIMAGETPTQSQKHISVASVACHVVPAAQLRDIIATMGWATAGE